MALSRKLWVSFFFVSQMSFGFVSSFTPGKLDFGVRVKDLLNRYETASFFLLPGEVVALEAVGGAGGQFHLTASGGEILGSEARKWNWKAPAKAGIYPIVVSESDQGPKMTLRAFVMVPFQALKKGVLNGYRIGDYPRSGLGGYHPPKGFVEVTKENEETYVSPHFQLKQFLCKQQGGYPKYLVLRSSLLQRLERTLEKVNAVGIPAESLHVMSGYRTPHYNKVLGNVKLSRHCLGEAADVYLPDPKKQDARHAASLYSLIEEDHRDGKDGLPVGGLAKYRASSHHCPFVHVDVRGFPARWEG